MRNTLVYIIVVLLMGFVLSPKVILAAEKHYQPSKVVYDISSSDPAKLSNILDRVGLLQKIYANDSFEASIILVLHEGVIPLFKNALFSSDQEQQHLMARARSLAMGEIIEFKVCAVSAKMQKITKDQLHDFIAMVPMADAEIIKLQNSGYAYLH